MDCAGHAPLTLVTGRRLGRGLVVVISVAMLGGGADAAAYYLDRAADCDLARYYTGDAQPADPAGQGRGPAGRWCGHGAAALGLDGAVTGDGAPAFAALLDGRLPEGTVVGRPVLRTDPRSLLPAGPLVRELRRTAADRGVEVAGLFDDGGLAAAAQRLVDRVDAGRRDVRLDARTVADLTGAAGLNPHALYPKTGGQAGFAAAFGHAGAKVDVRRSGLDVVVSAPKSVSVLYALAGPRVAGAVLAAHERAVDEALGYLQRHTSHGLRGHHGGESRAQRISTDGFVAAAFTHHTSRENDPQLHTHLVIANLLHGTDGKWSAVDSRAVHLHARTAGCIYQAVLRGELTRTVGVAWEPIAKGVAEIVGIPRPVLRAFSRRRTAIETELDRTGGTGRRAAQRAAYRTRPAKTRTAEVSLRQRWAARVRELGHQPTALLQAALQRQAAPTLPAPEVVAAQLFGPAGLTRRVTSFDRRDVLQALTETLPAGLPVTGAQLEAAADRMLRDRDAIPLLHPAGELAGGRRWTAANLLVTEQTVLTVAATPTAVPAHDPDTAAAVADHSALTAEQRNLVVELLSSPASVDVVVGPAGSGKTALLRTTATGWRDLGVPLAGCALAAVTARRLEAATGIPSTSLTRLLADANRTDPTTGRPAGLAAQTVVVVDEASMVGTRDLAALARHVTAASGKLVLVGDPGQLPEIDAGGLFAALATHARPLSANQRQANAWERDALLALRGGDVDTAIGAFDDHNRISIAADASHARELLVEAYVEQRLAGTEPYDLVALANSRADATTLNLAIRSALVDVGLVHGSTARAVVDGTVREYAEGDVVVVTRNDHRRRLLNGTRATVAHTTRNTLTLQPETGAEFVTVPADWAAAHLDHGYALTVHKAQGLTVDVALVYGTAALSQQAGYVALSRGRTANHLFTAAETLQPAAPTVDVPRRFQLMRDTDPDRTDTLDALADRLRRRRAQVLAQRQRPAVDDHWPQPVRPARHELHISRGRDDDFGLSR